MYQLDPIKYSGDIHFNVKGLHMIWAIFGPHIFEFSNVILLPPSMFYESLNF